VQQRLEQKNGLDERKAFPWAKRVLVPALGAAMVLALLLGLGVFRRGAELSPEALAAEFPKQGSLVPTSLNQPDARQAAAQMSQLVGFNVSPPDFTPCGFALVGAVTTEVNHAKGVSFVYRRGCEVVVVSQLKATPQLKRFNKTTAVRGKQAHYATVKDLKLVVWQEGERLMSISCSQQVFVGPMGGMNCH
jgi:anti-sigma factor RsiW